MVALINRRYISLLLFPVFILLFMISCEKDNNKDEYEYVDSSFIVDTWINTFAKDSSIYIFKKNGKDVEFQFYTKKDGNQKHMETINYGKYKLTKNKILFDDNSDIWEYKILNKDSIKISRGNLELNYGRLLEP